MINYLSIRDFVTQYPEEKKFKVFRVFDGYMFTVKEVKEDTVVLNTDVNLEVSQDDEAYKVHESSLGLDYTQAKILDYTPKSLDKAVEAIEFRKELTTRLHNEVTWVFGRILKECFYPFKEDLKTVDKDNLILEISYDYEFDAVTKEAVYRLESTKWYNHLEEVVATKLQPKQYTGHQGMREAKVRRDNIIDSLKHDLDSFAKSGEDDNSLLVADLILELKESISLYVEYGSYEVFNVLDNSSNVLLFGEIAPSFTVRDFIKSKLDFITVESSNPDLYKGSLL